MTSQEFSDQFDVLYNNIMSNSAPGLNEYEKSVFLTKAQNEIILNHFNPNGNKYKEGFDDSPKRQIDFSELISNSSVSTSTTTGAFDPRGKIFILPIEVLIILNEKYKTITDTVTKYYNVFPISFTEYDRLMSKPYKEPLKYQVWRLIKDGATSGIPNVEIIPHTQTITSDEYSLRYIRRPKPIILDNLQGLTIDGVGIISECELNPIVHNEILSRAVELAKVAYLGDLKSTVELNQRSE